MNSDLLAALKTHLDGVQSLKRTISALPGVRVERVAVRDDAHAISTRWFSEIKPLLETKAPEATLTSLSSFFEEILTLARSRSRSSLYLSVIQNIIDRYQVQLIHAVEIGSISVQPSLSIAPYVAGLSPAEGTYLDEAQRCLSVNALKGCVILGWCATVARIHEHIKKIGFEKFNQASEQMVARDYGRFKPFKKKFKVDSSSELQQVFDTNLLWILEFLELIDSNQHQRLRTCFELRNHSAHPGQAPVEPENVYAFYSDITKIILKNPNFSET